MARKVAFEEDAEAIRQGIRDVLTNLEALNEMASAVREDFQTLRGIAMASEGDDGSIDSSLYPTKQMQLMIAYVGKVEHIVRSLRSDSFVRAVLGHDIAKASGVTTYTSKQVIDVLLRVAKKSGVAEETILAAFDEATSQPGQP